MTLLEQLEKAAMARFPGYFEAIARRERAVSALSQATLEHKAATLAVTAFGPGPDGVRWAIHELSTTLGMPVVVDDTKLTQDQCACGIQRSSCRYHA